MRRRIPARTEIQSMNGAKKTFAYLDPNEIKSIVRDGLAKMTLADREEFIQILEAEMKRSNLNLRAYLVPLGIPGRTPEELTPTEVGHLIRFLKINVTNALKAIERTLSSFTIFDETMGINRTRLAA
jgi:hypothetical protein